MRTFHSGAVSSLWETSNTLKKPVVVATTGFLDQQGRLSQERRSGSILEAHRLQAVYHRVVSIVKVLKV